MKEVNLMKYGSLWGMLMGYLLRKNMVIYLAEWDNRRVRKLARFGFL